MTKSAQEEPVTPVTQETPKSEAPIVDTSKMSSEAINQLVDHLTLQKREANDEAKKYRLQLDDLQKNFKELEASKVKMESIVKKVSLETAAQKAGLIDMDTINLMDFSKIEFDTNFQAKDVEKHFEEFKKVKPHFFKTEDVKPPSFGFAPVSTDRKVSGKASTDKLISEIVTNR